MKAFAILIAAVLAVAALAWLDTAEYRELAASYRSAAREPLAQLARLEQQDQQRYQRCDPQRFENRARNTIDFTPEGRRCLIAALEQAGTVAGTLALVRNASVILQKEPQDQPVRAAALAALDRAHDALGAQKSWRYDRLERIGQAHAASVLMRLRQSPAPGPDFAQLVQLLDRAEYAIHLPQLHQSQQIRRLERRWPVTAQP